MDNITIRECTHTDLHQIVSLQKSWETEDITYGFEPADINDLAGKLGRYFFIAEQNEVILGFVIGTVNKAANMAVFEDGQVYLEINDIYVTASHRSTGLGGYLLDKLLAAAKEDGIERSLVYSSTKALDRLIEFYKSRDYKTWFIQMYK